MIIVNYVWIVLLFFLRRGLRDLAKLRFFNRIFRTLHVITNVVSYTNSCPWFGLGYFWNWELLNPLFDTVNHGLVNSLLAIILHILLLIY